ncbi:MAG TPA: RHS repeat-associated core domain-containing protein [Candidatus Eisenbacteria bacterium]|nr:RHS repeat-associated core domain-containing protein [Candidatus Eisenbacteria bacterium]
MSWKDANANLYGPVTSAFDTQVTVKVRSEIQTVTTSTAIGNFFAEPASALSFAAKPGDIPAFSQSFPTIDFNPPSGIVINNISGVGPLTRPFTDVTTDLNGDFTGTIVAQGNGAQAGLGTLKTFDAVFTASMFVSKAGDVTFNVFTADGFLLGFGNGATRVSGSYENPPASGTTPFNGYPLQGAFNQPGPGSPGTYPVTVFFPAAGAYPYELDYFSCCGSQLSLTMTVATFTAATSPLSVYVGYADGLRPAGSIFPFPWQGSPGVVFVGGGCCDNGAMRFDNSSDSPITFDHVTVDISGAHFDIWPRNLTIPPHQIMILSGTAGDNFDTSDFGGTPCGVNSGLIPVIHVTQGTVTTDFRDTGQILNTFGYDLACQRNESLSWQRIGGGGTAINVPLPPSDTLTLAPALAQGHMVGQTQVVTVAAMDGSGKAVANLPLTLIVSGANGQQLHQNTDASGVATFSYVGYTAGTDGVNATAFIFGLRVVSNTTSVTWVIPGGGTAGQAGPAITSPSPADGTVVTKPVAIDAVIAPPAGQSIQNWSFTYQPAAGGTVVTLKAGTGSPPSPLAIFDPTLLRNDIYAITVSATASGGGTQSLTTTVAVAGSLKLGRYVTTIRDLLVPVSGFQMALTRTYDSIDTRSTDFGTHWRVSVSNFAITANRQLGAGGWTEYPIRCTFGQCDWGFKTTTPHYVTVTYPDGQQEIFDFTPIGGSGILYFQGTAAFTARPGTHSKLEAAASIDTTLVNQFDGNLIGNSGGPYNPSRFRLTTRQGQVLILDTTSGLVSMTDRNGNSLTVDASGVHASNGASLTFTRDSQGRISRVTGPSGQVLSYAYSAAGNLTSSTDPDGNVTTYAYDASGRLTSVTGATGTVLQRLEYDAAGRLVAVIDANGNRSPISNDVPGQKQTFTDPMALATRIDTYDDLGDLVRSDVVPTTGPTLTTTSTYDSEGHPTSRTDPGGITIRATYDAAGNPVQGIDALGRVLTYAYNANADLLSVTAPDGTTPNRYSYDAAGNLLTVTRSDGSVQMTYDAQGHPLTITDSLGNVTRYVYDAGGHAVQVTDPAGAVSRFAVDGSGRVTSAIDPLGAAINFTYDAAGQLTAITNAAGNRVSFTYDGLGHQVSTSDLSGHATTLTYDANGRILSTADPSGPTTTYAYDANGRLVRQAVGSQVTTSAYDALGRPVQVQNESASVALTYDPAGRVGGETTSAVGGSGIPTTGMTYTYDAVGGRLSATGPAGTTRYAYDSLERLIGVTDPAGGSFGITYDGLGRPVGLARPNGVSDSMTYDTAGHLAGIQSRLAAGIVAASSYTVDPAGRRSSVTDAGGAVTRYTHDAFGSLTSVATSAATVAYTYDARGNRLSRGTSAYTYDAGDRMTSDGTFTYTYDAGGRMLTKTDATGAVTRYTWNGRGQLIGITLPSGSVVSYLYDPFGRRVAVNAAGVVTRYAYDGPNLTAEYDGANTLVAGYIGLPTVDQQLEMTRGGQRYFYVRDGSNSVVALTDLAGSTAATYSYDAFGVPGASTGSVTNPLRYTGREYDASSGLYYYRARYYDPNSGRFLSEDPIRHLNPYPYAANDPVDFNDPSGALFIEYIALVADQFHRATAIGTFAACLGNLLYTGLKDFQGLSSATICRSLAHSLRDLAIGLLDNPFVDAAFGPHDLLHNAVAAGNLYGTAGGAANELFTISGVDYTVFWDIHGFVRSPGGVRAVPGGPRILVVENERVYWKPFPGAGLIGTIVGTGLGAGLDAHDFLTVLLDPDHRVCE